MALATQINTLATRIGNYLRDSVLPRVLPSGGTDGQALVKTSGTDYAVSWSSSATLLAAALSVSPVAYGYAEIVVAAVGVKPGSKVVAVFSGSPDDENDIEEWADCALTVVGAPEVDQIRFVLVSGNGAPFVGVFNIDYRVS